MKREISDEELKRFRPYVFYIDIFVPNRYADSPKIIKELQEIEELMDAWELPLFEVYASLRLLGLKHLAYIFERPPRKPWNKTSEKIYLHCGTIYYYITVPSWLLDERIIKYEINKLWSWINNTSPRDKEFQELARKIVELRARRSILAFPEDLKDPEGNWKKLAVEDDIPKDEIEWKLEYESQYEKLKTVALALAKTRELAKKYGVYLLLTLMSD